MRFLAKFAVAALVLLAGNACRQNTTTPPVAEKPDSKKAISEILRPLVEKELGLPVALNIQSFKEEENHTFIMASMQQPDGSKMDFSKSPFKIPVDAFSEDVAALLKIKF